MFEQKPKEKVKVPLKVNSDIKDMVEPIVVRRSLLRRAGMGLLAAVMIIGVAWYMFFLPPNGEDLLDDVIEVAGGLDNWNKIDEGKFTRTRYLFDEDGKVIDIQPANYFFTKGDKDFKIVIDTKTPNGEVVIGYDGEKYWATDGGQPADPPGVARPLGMMCESEHCTPTCAAEMAFYRFSMPFKLKDPGVIPRYTGTADLNGREMQLLEITYDPKVGRDRWVLFVDKESKLIRKIEHYTGKDENVPPEEIYWSEHKAHAGITFSTKNTYYRSNGNKLEEYVISDIDFISSLPESVFHANTFDHDHASM